MKKIIFLTGIHGSGKGYLSTLLKTEFDINIYTASMLIKMAGGNINVNKKETNIKDNQRLLVDAINKYVDDNFFILDGHTCLLNKYGIIEKINLHWLNEINFVGIICLTDDIKIIKDRLKKRDNIDFDLNLLYNFQLTELENAKYLSEKNNIPFIKLEGNNNIDEVVKFLNSFKT